jgi:hypothetical protein
MLLSQIKLTFPVIETNRKEIYLSTKVSLNKMTELGIRRNQLLNWQIIDFEGNVYTIIRTVKIKIDFDFMSLLFMNLVYFVDHEIRKDKFISEEEYISLFRKYMNRERRGFINGDIIDEIEKADQGPDTMEKVLRVAAVLKKNNYA